MMLRLIQQMRSLPKRRNRQAQYPQAQYPQAQNRFLVLLVGAVGLVLFCHYVPCRLLFDQPALARYLDMAGGSAIGLFLLAHVIATAIGLPGTILVVTGGAVFGLVWGTIWSTIGATLGAIAAFSIARFLLRDWIEERFGHHSAMQSLKQMLSCYHFNCVLAVRFAPISPFNLVNFLFGVTPVDFKPYAVGTLLGIIPGTAAYTWLGVSGLKAFQGQGWAELLAALCVLMLLSLLPILLKRLASYR
jgi:uncharacterized membrane protein YdjX (TVP38/TMEM64 family)